MSMDTLGSSAMGFSGDLSGVEAMDVGAQGLLGLLTATRLSTPTTPIINTKKEARA